MINTNSYQESRNDVKKHLMNLKLALQSTNCKIDIIPKKKNETYDDPFTTFATLNELEYDIDDVRQELLSLEISNYKENMKDSINPASNDFHVFGKIIAGREVYIKEKLRNNSNVFCISFHFARFPLKNSPYQ